MAHSWTWSTRSRRLPWLWLFGLVGLIVAGCSGQEPTAVRPVPVRTPLPAIQPADADLPTVRAIAAEGGHLYQVHCVTCHGQQGTGDGPAAAALRPRPTNFRDVDYMRLQTPGWYFKAISEGVTGSAMMRWDHSLDATARWDVAFYVWSMASRPDILRHGAQVYRDRCMSCHGADGAGVEAARLNDPARVTRSRQTDLEAIQAQHPELMVSVPVANGLASAQVAGGGATSSVADARTTSAVAEARATSVMTALLQASDLEAADEFIWSFLYQPLGSLPSLSSNGALHAVSPAAGPALPEGEVCPTD